MAAEGTLWHTPILEALFAVAGGPAALHEPSFEGNEWAYVKECIDAGWVSTAGSFVGRFEKMLSDITGVEHAIAVNTGTAALHAALLATGVGAGDEVLMPALTFVATANAVAHAGALPHFVEVEERTLGVDPDRLRAYLSETLDASGGIAVNTRTGRPVKALVCVHVFGHPARVDVVADVCADFGLTLIEDAAESIGSYYKGRHTGGFGRVGTLSFNGNKTVTSGAGGALVTHDAELAARIRHLTTTAKKPHPWAFEHDMVGYNYRLPNLNAALGCAQLELLDEFVARKRRLAERYRQAFAGVAGVSVFEEPEGAESNYWLNALLLDELDAAMRDDLLAAANDAGLGLRPAWTPMHRLAMYETCPRDDLSVTDALCARIVNLPSGPGIGKEAARG